METGANFTTISYDPSEGSPEISMEAPTTLTPELIDELLAICNDLKAEWSEILAPAVFKKDPDNRLSDEEKKGYIRIAELQQWLLDRTQYVNTDIRRGAKTDERLAFILEERDHALQLGRRIALQAMRYMPQIAQ